MARRDRTRRTLSERDRLELFRRDGYRYGYCGKRRKHTNLVVDHIITVTEGGEHGPANWVTACRACNREKWLGVRGRDEEAPRLRWHSRRLVAKCTVLGPTGVRRRPRLSWVRRAHGAAGRRFG